MNRLLSLLNLPSVLGITKLMITNPRKLYSYMPQAGGYLDPTVFVGIMSAIASLIIFSGILLTQGTTLDLTHGLTDLGIFNTELYQRFTFPLWYLILLPLAGIASGFVIGSILFVIWNLFGSEHDFEVAYRCVAYSLVLLPVFALLHIIPYAGMTLCVLWWFALVIEASHVVHGLSRIKITVFLMLVALVWLFFLFKEDQIVNITTNRLEQFNDQMRELEERTTELEQ